MERLVTIGQFSELTRVSQKALRIYAANGLLQPTRVDPDSGYRYYRPEQIPVARMIGLLRDCGMPLREIRRFLLSPDPSDLDEYEQRLEAELGARRELLRYVRRMLEVESMFEVKTKQLPAQHYKSRTKHVRIPDLQPFIMDTIGELVENGDGPPFAVYHGKVNELDDGPVEVGVPYADGDLELPAGEVAYTTVSGDDCDFPQILGAYDALARWMSENGRETAAAPREVYFDRYSWEIVWPLK